jgi:hypothetical protein
MSPVILKVSSVKRMKTWSLKGNDYGKLFHRFRRFFMKKRSKLGVGVNDHLGILKLVDFQCYKM